MVEGNKQSSVVYSNRRIFFDIAKESICSMNSLMQNGRNPKPNGELGCIITYDPKHKSFKESMVVMVFCGMYLESLLHRLIVEKDSIEKFIEYDRKSYEEKLKLLDCIDEKILEDCEHYRTVRREIVHEKAYLDDNCIRVAQKEATRAFNMIESINAHFEIDL